MGSAEKHPNGMLANTPVPSIPDIRGPDSRTIYNRLETE